MKNRIFAIIVFFLAAIARCKKDEETVIAPPTIKNFEVGFNNNKLYKRVFEISDFRLSKFPFFC